MQWMRSPPACSSVPGAQGESFGILEYWVEQTLIQRHRLRYNPDDFKSWIQPSEEAVTANNENQPKDKLQDHDLVLQNATDV